MAATANRTAPFAGAAGPSPHEHRDPDYPQDYPNELPCREGIAHPDRGHQRREHHGGQVEDGGSEGGRQVDLGGECLGEG